MRNLAVGTSAALLLAVGGSSPTFETPTSETLIQERIDFVNHESDANRAFWVSHGLGGVANINLVVLQGNDSFVCKSITSETTLTATDQTSYCPENDTIAVTALSVNAHYMEGGLGKFGVAMSLAHEYGHAIQDLENRLNPLYYNSDAKVSLELDATKLAGSSLATRYGPVALHTMASKLRQISPPSHGGPAQANMLLEGAGLTAK